MSTADDFDVSETLKAKSDQLNAADLSGRKIRVQILGATKMSDERQPVAYRVSGGHMPWRPPKCMRRLMATIASSTRTGPWMGMWVELYADARVFYGKDPTGGVRICGIDARMLPEKQTFTVRDSRGYLRYEIEPIGTDQQQNAGGTTANLDALLAENGLTREAANGWRAARNPPKPPVETLNDMERAQFATWLAANPDRLKELHAFVPAAPSPSAVAEPTDDDTDTDNDNDDQE